MSRQGAAAAWTLLAAILVLSPVPGRAADPPPVLDEPFVSISSISSSFEAFSETAACPWGFVHNGIDLMPQPATGSLNPYAASDSGTITSITTGQNGANWRVNVGLSYNSTYSAEYVFETFSSSTLDRDKQLANIVVGVGQHVAKGQIIGYLNSAGGGGHVHWGLLKEGRAICPELYLDTSTSVKTDLLNLLHVNQPTANLCYPSPHSIGGAAVSGVGSTILDVAWAQNSPADDATPVMVLATDSAFTHVVSSGPGTLGQLTTTYLNLSPSTTYWFEVKGATEADSLYLFNQMKAVTPTGSSAVINGGQGASYTLDVLLDQQLSVPVVITVPAGTFAQQVTMSYGVPASFPAPVSQAGKLIPLGQAFNVAVGLSVSTLEGLQPAQPVTLAFSIPTALLTFLGVDPSTLVVARYDSASGVWSPLLPSSYDASTGVLTASTSHFSLFEVMTSSPSADLSSIKVFPNPFRPNRGQSSMNLVNLVSGSSVRLFNLLGEELRELTADKTGVVQWDGKNAAGQNVASGLYFAVVDTGSQRKVVKLAVER